MYVMNNLLDTNTCMLFDALYLRGVSLEMKTDNSY